MRPRALGGIGWEPGSEPAPAAGPETPWALDAPALTVAVRDHVREVRLVTVRRARGADERSANEADGIAVLVRERRQMRTGITWPPDSGERREAVLILVSAIRASSMSVVQKARVSAKVI